MSRPTAEALVRQAWGKAIRRRREKLELTQEQAANLAAVDQTTLSKIELGKYRSMTPDLIFRITAALDSEVEDLFGWPHGIDAIATYEREAVA